MTRPVKACQKRPHRVALAVGSTLGLISVLGGCGGDLSGSEDSSPPSVSASASADIDADTKDAEYPDVLGAVLESDGNGAWSLEVTLSSEYDSPQRYANGWRVLDAEGNELGEHTLGHDHADEQPVTRTQSDLEIPDGVDVVTVQGRDTENGFGGATLEMKVPR